MAQREWLEMNVRSKLKKVCEICGSKNKSTIDKHHIIPRTDPRTTDNISNLAIICSNCHRRVHAGEIIIEGVYTTSAGTLLFWHYSDKPWTIRPGIFLQKDGTAKIVEAPND